MSAARRVHKNQLVFGFNALGDGPDSEAPPKTSDRGHDRSAVGILREFIYKRAIDFNFVEGKHPEITE